MGLDNNNKECELKESLAAIKECFEGEDVVVSVRNPPGYITHFLPNEQNREIILVYKSLPPVTNMPSADHQNGSDFIHSAEMSGNPLEAPFGDDTINVTFNFNDVIHTESEINKHCPLSVLSARYCLSMCNTDIKPPLPVWILTDSSDLNKTVLLSTELHNGWNTRCHAVQNNDDITIECMLKSHMKHSFLKNTNQIKYRSKVSSTFNKNLSYCKDNCNEIYSHTMIKMSWDELVVKPPLNSKTLDVQVVTKCHIGSGSDGLAFFWNELLLLNSVLEIIENKQSFRFREQTEPYLQILQKLKSELKKEPQITKENIKALFAPDISFIIAKGETVKTLENILNTFMSVNRPNLDTTDKLWHLLLTCTCIEDISFYIKQVDELNQSLSLFVGNGNISRFATVLQGGHGHISDALEYFVEIGLEKLRKQIYSIFSEARIASPFSLNTPKYLSFSNVKAANWMETARGWLNWICKVYSALELLINTQKALTLRNETMEGHATKLLEEITTRDSKVKGIQWILENRYQELKWPIKSQFIEKQINITPDYWMLVLESSFKECHHIKSIFTRSNQTVFPSNNMIDLNKSINLNKTDVSIYEQKSNYWLEMHAISNKIS
ncbi:uncharacterized protein LOC106661181 isoform X2 [Cimex lectularius]|uniref:Protein zwilch n=1 Tax=Cimex lectularius TaxID=79782 RepID=A0A8I6R9P8_CIMLE|nr:uncharacterized protein LOC106661181 isoform X2 [Cimex lectularius]